jgi:parallel beta-helix repeat protein
MRGFAISLIVVLMLGVVTAGYVVADSSNDAKSYIIEFEGEPLLSQKGVSGKSMGALKANDVDVFSERHKKTKDKIVARLGKGFKGLSIKKRSVKEFKHAFNGIAMELTSEQLKEVKKLSSVKAVHEDKPVHALLDNSIRFIGAEDVWQIPKDVNTNLTGKGVTIAILDSGIDYRHEAFNNCSNVGTGGCRVVYGYDFVNNDPDALDDHGHGTHVASTAAGNGTYKGVAPDAELIAYKVLDESGNGDSSYVMQAIDDAMSGINTNIPDVISMSLGGDVSEPLRESIQNAISAGTVVVVAAGNSGPGGDTNCGSDGSWQSLCFPGSMHEVITVGASKSDIGRTSSLAVNGSIVYESFALLKSGVGSTGTVRIINVTEVGSASNFSYGNFVGRIAIIERNEVVSPTQIAINAEAVGAVGLIIYGEVPSDDYLAFNSTIPVIAVNQTNGTQILSMISTYNITGSITVTKDEGYPYRYPEVKLFSSRGPSSTYRIKPDIVAPGENIYAAAVGGGHVSMSGTSMATPHVSGAIALLIQNNTDWTPGEVKMALRNSSINHYLNITMQGWGGLNLSALVAVNETPCVVDFAVADYSVSRTNNYTINGSVSCRGRTTGNWTLEYGRYQYPYSWDTILSSSGDVDNTTLANLDLRNKPSGLYNLRLRADGGEDRVFLMVSSNTITSCGQLSTANTYYILNNHINLTDETCITVTADNVVFDMGNKIVWQDGAQLEYGIFLNSSNNFTVKNGGIYRFDKGIGIYNSFNNTIVNVSVYQNQFGIYFSNASYNIMNGNSAFLNLHGYYFLGRTSISNTIINSYFYSNSDSGIVFDETSSNLIQNSSFYNNTINDFSDTVFKIASKISYCNHQLINVTGAGGLPIYYASDPVILANAEYSELILCNADNSSLTNITIKGDDVKDNNGLYLYGLSNVSIDGVNSTDNQYGVYILNSENLTFVNSTFSGNQVDGVRLDDVSSSVFVNNTLNINGRHGYYLTGGNNNITGGVINGSVNNALYVVGNQSHHNIFSNITINNTAEYDVYLLTNYLNGTTFVNQALASYLFNNQRVIIRDTRYGEINFLEPLNVDGTNLSFDVQIENNSVSVNVSNTPELNVSANVTLYNIGNRTFIGPIILKDGSACTTCNNFTGLVAETVVFNVTGFSNYSIGGSRLFYRCNDTEDEDNDGLIDLVDPGCSAWNDDSEYSEGNLTPVITIRYPTNNVAYNVTTRGIIFDANFSRTLLYLNYMVNNVTFNITSSLVNRSINTSISLVEYGNQTLFLSYKSMQNTIGNYTINFTTTLYLNSSTDDFDGDGVNDSEDTIIGNASNVFTTYDNLSVVVNSSTNLSQAFNTTLNVTIKQDNITLVEFNNNFSETSLNLTGLIVKNESVGNLSKILINGLNVSSKTVYLSLLGNKTHFGSICIKDAEIYDFLQISADCTGASETYVISILDYSGLYTINYSNSSNTTVRIEGLSNSGIRQMCTESWSCSGWAGCSSGSQARTCTDANSCSTINERPALTNACGASGGSSGGSSGGGVGGGGTAYTPFDIVGSDPARMRFRMYYNMSFRGKNTLVIFYNTGGNLSIRLIDYNNTEVLADGLNMEVPQLGWKLVFNKVSSSSGDVAASVLAKPEGELNSNTIVSDKEEVKTKSDDKEPETITYLEDEEPLLLMWQIIFIVVLLLLIIGGAGFAVWYFFYRNYTRYKLWEE